MDRSADLTIPSADSGNPVPRAALYPVLSGCGRRSLLGLCEDYVSSIAAIDLQDDRPPPFVVSQGLARHALARTIKIRAPKMMR